MRLSSRALGVRTLFFLIMALFVLAALVACAGGAAPTPTTAAKAPAASPAAASPAAAGPGNAQEGQLAIQKYNCGGCHTIPGIPGANGTVGPSLAGIGSRSTIASTLPNNHDNLVRWIENPQAVKPGTQMPNLGVSPTDANNIAAYLQTLK